MPRFKVEVYPEPMSATHCGRACIHLARRYGEHLVWRCGLFGRDLAKTVSKEALRCEACIEAERKANDG